MWDESCEAEVRSLLNGFANGEGKPPLERQRETAAWLNQRLPYPGWELCLAGVEPPYWVVARDGFGKFYYALGYYYLTNRPGMFGETLLEALTTLEMGLCV